MVLLLDWRCIAVATLLHFCLSSHQLRFEVVLNVVRHGRKQASRVQILGFRTRTKQEALRIIAQLLGLLRLQGG